MVPGWLRLAIDSQNKARNGFVSTIKTCNLDSVTIQHPILNIKSGFPQNMILGHLFSVLRASDLQKGWDSEGRGDFFLKKKTFKKEAFTSSIAIRIFNRQEVSFQIHW